MSNKPTYYLLNYGDFNEAGAVAITRKRKKRPQNRLSVSDT